MTEEFNLQRFVEAQDPIYHTVTEELRIGRKRTHWMWFIFPQLKGLGWSSTARFYGIESLSEARAYLEHKTLSSRLIECATLVHQVEGKSARQILSTPDDLKLRSSVTLFRKADSTLEIFQSVLDKFYDGQADDKTLELLRQ